MSDAEAAKKRLWMISYRSFDSSHRGRYEIGSAFTYLHPIEWRKTFIVENPGKGCNILFAIQEEEE